MTDQERIKELETALRDIRRYFNDNGYVGNEPEYVIITKALKPTHRNGK